jgi:hypothetical protein
MQSFQFFPFFRPFLCRSMRVSWREKWRHFAWPVRDLKVEFFRSEKRTRILTSLGFCHFFQIFKIPILSTLKDQSKCLSFFGPGYFFVYIREAGAYYPIAGTPSLEPKHETCTHTQILTSIQPPIGPLEVISRSRQTWLGILKGIFRVKAIDDMSIKQ